ncbi:hypothetical protein GIB67_035472 [Kingdonia uniflora]|uniref:Enhancer of polycomb-like protein n=1 Tax=Kingdonia uniflora TaxID=39325 RepID=A0A7J7P165_9MAGN|nr:hypothetical protein GIB67_035472 [Kingdonia uniflora]
MGTSVQISDLPEIVPNSRSLDLQNLFVAKSRGSGEWAAVEKPLKRKRSSNSGEGIGEKKKSKICKFEPVTKHSGDNLHETHEVLDKRDTTSKENGRILGDNNAQNSSNSTKVAHNLVDNVAPNPKRPRGVSRRKKSQDNQVPLDVSDNPKIVELNGDSVTTTALSTKVTQRRVFDDLQENSLSGSNSVQNFIGKNGSVVRCDDPISDCPIDLDRGKGEELEPPDRCSSEVGEPSTVSVRKSYENLQEEDEENLEENAARMLSSMKGMLFEPSLHGDFVSSQANSSADIDSRVLRPREQGKEKTRVGKRPRRHFYEIFSRDLNDAYWVLNKRAKVLWPLDNKWYFGLVTSYDPLIKKHHVRYDDRDEEWIDLHKERFKLLLFPSEAPPKSRSRKSKLGDKCSAEGKEDLTVDDDNCVGYMDSEPIISWLARASRRIKSSPLGIIKRQKTSSLCKSLNPPAMSEDSVGTSRGSFVTEPSRAGARSLSCISMLDRTANGEVAGKSTMESSTTYHDRKVTRVYFRKRFHRRDMLLDCASVAGSVTFPASVVDQVGALEENDSGPQNTCGKDSIQLDCDDLLRSGKNMKSLMLILPSMKIIQVQLRLENLLIGIRNIVFGTEDLWVCRAVLMLRYGALMTLWPKVKLEILFVDNVVGLRFVLFEGSLMEAVSFVCLVLVTFHQPNLHGEVLETEVPVTSIRFELSRFQKRGRPLVFLFYNFLQIQKTKWACLDDKLKQHCSIIKQLPLEECTHDNINILQNGSNALPISSACSEPASLEVFQKRPRQSTIQLGIFQEPVKIDVGHSSSKHNEKCQRLPPFLLPFSAAPTFFLSLHLKLLMAKSITSVSFHNPMALLRGSENMSRSMNAEQSIDNDSYDQIELGNTKAGCSSENLASTEFNGTATSLAPEVSTKNVSDTDKPQRHHCPYLGSKNCEVIGMLCPSCPMDNMSSHLSSISVRIPSLDQPETLSFDTGPLSAPQPTSDTTWSLNDGTPNSPKTTAPRSIWKHNQHDVGSMSFSYSSRIWPDEKADVMRKGPVKGSRKSYLLPFGGCDFSSRPRSHHRKGRIFKSIKNDVETVMPSCSRNPRRHPELLSCDANVLITVEDRGWRVSGANIVLECVGHNDWKLLVKFSGDTKYSYKAYQFLQPGTTNRYNHAMMWRGGKDWVLEFPDRIQWAIFKEMHEECYNRNVRAASVKTIPIPGVHLIEEIDDDILAVPFVRAPKYFRQFGTEVDMALNPSYVLYDMESDDEEWIANYKSSSDTDGSNSMEISEEMLERAMDVFEKIAYAQECNCFTADEVEEIAVGVGPVDVIKAIYVHWQQKRRRKGMPLIRQLQPPLWEIYQHQVKEWESTPNKYHYLPNGCREKPVLTEKPPMFAFCLRPRGLEVPNKFSKQRPQRKVTGGGHNYAFSRYQDNGHHVNGRKSNGCGYDEERLGNGQNHETLYASQWHSSPRDAFSSEYLSFSSDGSERSQQRLKHHRKKSRKMPKFHQLNDSYRMEMQCNQEINKRKGSTGWNMGLPEWPSQRQRVEELSVSDLDEFTLRDASSAAKHASNMAKLKRENAQRLLYRADLAIHKAVVALMTAEAVNASSASTKDSMQED